MSRHFCCNLTIEAWHRRFKQPGRSGDATRPSVAGGSPDYSPENVPYQPGLLFQSEVRSVFVIVGDVIGEKSLQMSLVQHDCVVEQLTATTAYPALSLCVPRHYSKRTKNGADSERTLLTDVADRHV